MGAWGKGTFDNDIACDWASCLHNVEDLALIRKTIAEVVSTGSEYLELELACEALAACEVLACLRGNRGKRDTLTESVDAWLREHPITPPAELVQQAVQALDRIASPPSELLEQAEGDVEWHEVLTDLRARIGG
jgi:Domain of unknown function (DUF4259)